VTPDGKVSVYLVQQGVWEMPMESMPLAAGYLKSTALADPRISEQVDIKILNYRGGVPLSAMANDLFGKSCPDIIGFSVLGWNYRSFGELATTFKQLNPAGWVLAGGTHVANQAPRVFRMFPEIDVVINGEGELTFKDVLLAYLDGTPRHSLSAVNGISYQNLDGQATTTLPRDRIEDLDIIPSPTLTGALELVDESNRFRYDVALMETNRGCPYKCSFCYWGGAVGQRVRAFSRQRLREELELFAQHKVWTVALCDANFGLLPIDEEFVDDLIEIRQKYGYPRALESSWAKNKSKVFYNIVRKMKDAGLRSSFTLALQTLSGDALQKMNRRNMKVNEWDDLVDWLNAEGLECYGELIWGAPGETVQSFLEGYDRLARRVSRIAVYPILLLPNTEYAEKKEEYGIISVRGDTDDFEYVLAHETMSFADNQRMQRFLFWSRVMADASVLRHTWIALRELAEFSQSGALENLDAWVERTEDPAAEPLRQVAKIGTAAPGAAIDYMFSSPDAKSLLERWWRESLRALLPADRVDVLDEIFRYDLLTMPVYRSAGTETPAEDIPIVEVGGESYYRRADVRLRYDVPGILADLRAHRTPTLTPKETVFPLYYRIGVETWTNTTNSEEIVYFMGMTEDQVTSIPGGAEQDRTAEDGAATSYSALLADKGGCS
jgi:radical SAM C-methyltransferase